MKKCTRKKLALHWRDEKGFNVPVRVKPAKPTPGTAHSASILVLSENQTSFYRKRRGAAAA